MVPLFKRALTGILFLMAVLAQPQASQGQSLTITTFAGTDGGPGFDDGPDGAARFFFSRGMATDSRGNIYVADTENHTIRKITPAGAVTTLAGLAGVPGSVDGTGSAARFNGPTGVAIDSGGNVYVADQSNNTIRRITSAGAVTTFAGRALNSGSVDGIGSAARFDSPSGVAINSSGNLYVADQSNNTIRQITPAGAVTTLAGLAGEFGSVDGTGSAARFGGPNGVATDNNGNVYVVDGFQAIRKINAAGAVTTLAGVATEGGSADGTGSAARFSNPIGVATDNSGNVYVVEFFGCRVRKITPTAEVTTLAGLANGSADGTGSEARFSFPRGIATDSSGNVFVADSQNHTIRKVTQAGVVTTIAGRAPESGSADGTASAARFTSPHGVAVDGSGNVFVADGESSTIRKITPTGAVTTLAGLAGQLGSADGTGSDARFFIPQGVAVDSNGNVYVADLLNQTIRKITPTGAVTTLAGMAQQSGSADGTGNAARFNRPRGVATDSSGNVFVADTENFTIRKITPAGGVTTLAGLAGQSGSVDGTGSAARFRFPWAIATDNSGNLYVTEQRTHTIRKITPAGVVTTLAGLAENFGSADGIGSAARFNSPIGIATDSSGNVYVADRDNYTIRKITPTGAVTTLAGTARMRGTADGTGGAARFFVPGGVATDSSGNLYVADEAANKIRIGRAALADVATIDAATGKSGSTRVLDTTPQTATSWQWSVIRRPADSSSILSSASVRNPTFTPDVPGLYTFRVTATGATGVSITTVDLNVFPVRRRAARSF